MIYSEANDSDKHRVHKQDDDLVRPNRLLRIPSVRHSVYMLFSFRVLIMRADRS